MTNVVIVGAGQAGGSAVLQLRSTGFEGEITLLGRSRIPHTSVRPCRKPISMVTCHTKVYSCAPSLFIKSRAFIC